MGAQILKMSAVLLSHGININLSNLYHANSATALKERSRLQRKIVLNGRFGTNRPKSPVKSSPNKMKKSSNSMSKKFRKKKKYTGPIVYDEKDLLEFAEGDISKVFGPKFKEIDQYARRVRLPMSEYLLCTRVTHVRGVDLENYVPCNYKKCSMVTEYDIPINGPHSEGGDVPWAILVESGQCDLMLISLLGVDFECKSERVYRLLDTTLTFYGIAKEGDTLVYDIQIDSFAKRPDGKGVSMFFFRYNCYVNGKLLIEMRNGCAGFFSDEELAAGKGIVYTKAVLDKRAKIKKKSIAPFLIEPAAKTSFSQRDMIGLVNCRWGDVVGPTARELNYKLVARKMLMIDQVTHVIPDGGAHGLGLIIGEKFLERDHWYFPCHFKGDQVMAGSLVSDGCSQMLKLYMVWLGLHKTVNNLSFRPVNGQPNKVRCRGQIPPHKGKLIYVMEIREMGFNKETGYPYCIADVDIIDVNHELGQEWKFSELETYGRGDMSKKIVVDFKGIALQIEGEPTARNPTRGGGAVSRAPSQSFVSQSGRRAPKPIQPPRNSLKSDPNAPNALIWHPLAGKNGNPTPYFDPTDYPPRPITFIPFPNNPNDNNHTPGELPLSWVNMCEFMRNKVSNCLGDEFQRFDDSTTSRSPAWDLALVTRVLSVTDLERGSFYNVDLNPAKGTMIAEFDCPADAWIYRGSSADSHMPYSILMEIALQPSGILTSWVKAPLTTDKDNILFRNLDATAELVKNVDLRGKTIRSVSRVTSYAMMGQMGIHKFFAELYVDDELFYTVDTSFGWFLPEVFENQVGLDQGEARQPWHLSEQGANLEQYNLTSGADRARLYRNTPRGYLRRRSDQSSYVDTIEVSSSSGKYNCGYASGSKVVNKQDWFFSCHFWCDPVMPGSLGVESMFECVEVFLIHAGHTSGFTRPQFDHGVGQTKWKYRGQLTPRSHLMQNEVHIKSVERQEDGSLLCIAEGYLFVDSLRVYETKQMRIVVREGERPKDRVPASPSLPVADAIPAGETKVRSRNHVAKRSVAAAQLSALTPEAKVNLLKEALLDVTAALRIGLDAEGGIREISSSNAQSDINVHPCSYAHLGNAGFLDTYGVDFPLYTGAMAKGIASAELVVAAGQSNMLASLGAGGLPLGKVEEALDIIQAALPHGPYAVNLIHSPFDDLLEKGCVDLLLRRGVRVVEASAFMKLTPHVVRYRVAGLERGHDGRTVCRNKIIFKVSRTELAEMALRPPPAKMVERLLAAGLITAEQAELSQTVPMCDDIAVEADSGGHTDNRPIHVIFPLIKNLRDRLHRELGFSRSRRVRVGVGGGIGCPEAALAAFSMGAAFVVTGTVNQMARQSGSCTYVREVLSKATYSDVVMAPAADMFDEGVELQVLKKGTLFPARAKKLRQLFQEYDSLDEIPDAEMRKLEKRTFQKSCAEVWQETKNFYINRLKDPEKVERAETVDPKLKMSMTFRWYLSKSSGWANRGDKGRELDYQIWCGPAIGSFNNFIRGSYLDPEVAGQFPCVVQINKQLLMGACYLRRLGALKREPHLCDDLTALDVYTPQGEL